MEYVRVVETVFFFNDTATTEIYTLSLHDALPIFTPKARTCAAGSTCPSPWPPRLVWARSTASPAVVWSTGACPASSTPARSEEHTSEPSHANISYAVFCLKKKNYNLL